HPNSAFRIGRHSRVDVRAGFAGQPYRGAGLSVLDRLGPEVEIALFICGPKHPRTAASIHRDRGTIQVAAGLGDGDGLAPIAARVLAQQDLIASGWRFERRKTRRRLSQWSA